MKSISEMDVDTHLGDKEVNTNAFLKDEANNQAIERVKVGSIKFCIRKDLAKEKMVFSQESSQAIFEMGTVELIELKTFLIQCPSCLHNVFKGTVLCQCGEHIRPDLEMMRRIKAAFVILKACFRTSAITARVCKYDPDLWQEHHHKAKDALRGASKGKREFTSIWDRWQDDETYRKSQLAHDWSDAWVRYLDHIVQFDISHKAPHEQRGRHKNLFYLRSVDKNKQSTLRPQRPGYQDAKKA